MKKKKQRDVINKGKNPVAKNIRKFNKPAVMKDRKKEMKKTGEQYHDKP